jgi:hypothetical protein
MYDDLIEEDESKLIESEDSFLDQEIIEEELAPVAFPKVEKKKRVGVDPVGVSFYGDSFTAWQKVAEYQDLLPAFKEFYYQKRIENNNVVISHLMKEFNAQIFEASGRKFHPYSQQVKIWRKRWDRDILEKKGMKMDEITTKKHVQQVLKTRGSGDMGLVEYKPPAYSDIELSVQTLAGELVNDAMQMLRDDQNLEDIYESDELIKRKSHVVNVFAHVTKLVHGKASLMLKASQEKRENAGFLMDLMNKASSGKMGVEEINSLRATYTVVPEEGVEVNELSHVA